MLFMYNIHAISAVAVIDSSRVNPDVRFIK